MNRIDNSSILDKTADHSRALLFGLLVNCIFSGQANGRCPISHLRDSLSFEEKYSFVMGLSKEEIARVLDQHEECCNAECYVTGGIDKLTGYPYP